MKGEVDLVVHGKEVFANYNAQVEAGTLNRGNFAAFNDDWGLVAQGKSLDELMRKLGEGPREAYRIADPSHLESNPQYRVSPRLMRPKDIELL